MSRYFCSNQAKRLVILFLTLSVAWSHSAPTAAAESPPPANPKPVIYIDPGHGGHDTGVRGIDNTLEKDIVFAVAETLSKSLTGRYELVLARSDDYNPDLFKRAEAANEIGADLFISIHAGGSFRHHPQCLTIFYYQALSENSTLAATDNALTQPSFFWDSVQIRHVSSSHRLAACLQGALQYEQGTTPCRVRAAPVVVLSGVNMPAVLIEFGSLTNPMEEHKLNDPIYRSTVSAAIIKGIEQFFAKKTSISSIDLHE